MSQAQEVFGTADLRLELRSRNNVLWHVIFDMYQSVADFCRANGFNDGQIGKFLNLKESPYSRGEQLRPVALRLCVFAGLDAETLFPLHLYSGRFSTRIAEVDSHRFVSLRAAGERLLLPPMQEEEIYHDEMKQRINKTLETLTPREEKVIKLRFGLQGEDEHSLEEIGVLFGVTRTRIRQIQQSALRKLQHPIRSRPLRAFLPYSEWIIKDKSGAGPETSEPTHETHDVPHVHETEDAPAAQPWSTRKRRQTRVETVYSIRLPFITYVTASVDELRSGAWTTDDAPAPPGGLNKTIVRVRVTTNDLPDRVTLEIHGFADRPY